MRKQIIVLASIIAVLVAGCSSQKPVVYHIGETYSFDVIFINEKGDTVNQCTLNMIPVKKSLWGQYGLKYYYEPCSSYPAYEETTSFCDNKNAIELHPPRMGALAFSGIVPYPQYTYPLGCIVSASGEINIIKSTFAPATGKTIRYEYEQRGVDTILFRGHHIECYTVQGENTSHHDSIGHYYVTYWFHPVYGFIRWRYTLPSDYCVIIQLKQ